jgi:hypothetical protein
LMSFDLEMLYSLLPVIYKLRDKEQGEPLKALLSVIAEQIGLIEEDLAQLYDDQFIETCAEWAVPYIGDLVGLRSAHGLTIESGVMRSEVANAIALRRRKGTAAALEELAYSSTGWRARAVEFFQLMATTQSMNHIRMDNQSLACIRRWQALEYIATPFDEVAHIADVRSIGRHRGRYNIPNVGIFLWRLQPFRIERGTSRKIKEGCYAFHPLGIDVPLFNFPQDEEEIAHIAEPFNVPETLRRRVLYEDLELLRKRRNEAKAGGASEEEASSEALKDSIYFGRDPALKIYVNGGEKPIPSWCLVICDLSEWTRPALSHEEASNPQDFPFKVAVDPVLGRLTFSIEINPERVEVGYSYGFSFKMGGGGYERPQLPKPDTSIPNDRDLIQDALNSSKENPERILEIEDSPTIEGDLEIHLNQGQKLTIRGGSKKRPLIAGSIVITPAKDAELTLDGLLISDQIRVVDGEVMELRISHCTLAPWLALDGNQNPIPRDKPSLTWEHPKTGSALILERSIIGRLMLGEGVDVEISGCIIDALDDSMYAILGGGGGEPKVSISGSTIIGRVQVREISGENSIFTGIVNSVRKQNLCIRFCYLPEASQAPRRHCCQPNMAIRQAKEEAKVKSPMISETELENIRKDLEQRIRPSFTDLDFSKPGYAQLRTSCPLEIRVGADDGSEMGAFHDLHQPRREANLCERLKEHLRFGLDAGIFYVN